MTPYNIKVKHIPADKNTFADALIPGSQNLPLTKEDRNKMIKARQDRQTKVLLSKKTSNPNFKVGNKVRIYNSYSQLWDITGEIIQEIPAEDGISRSFLVRDEDNNEIWRIPSS